MLAPALAAQSSATIDVGLSWVHYDGFLPSAAWSVTPALDLASATASLALRGTFLGFESGRSNVQGSAAGSVFIPAAGALRPEVHAALGASRYADIAEFGHGKVGLRLHRVGPGVSGWVGATVGLAVLDPEVQSLTTYGAGVWHGRRTWNVSLSATRTAMAEAAYTDFESRLRVRRGRLDLAGWVGARVWSRGGGHGLYGDVAVTMGLKPALSATLATGRYPADVTLGTISGRYITAGLRLGGQERRARAVPRPVVLREPVYVPSTDRAVTATLELRHQGGGVYAFRIEAPGAALVELAGDFTDWQPAALVRCGGDAWEITLPVAAGTHWVNIRIDGGPWIVPAGVAQTADDFGAAVGLIVVP